MGRGVGADGVRDLGGSLGGVEIALAEGDPARDRMHVRVLEPRQYHPAREIDRLGTRPNEPSRQAVDPHVDDAPAAHRDGGGPAPRRVHGVDGAVPEHEVGGRRVPLWGRAGRPAAA